MTELEIYAAGVRAENIVLELDQLLGAFPNLRYKIDRNHDIVYFESDEPKFTVRDILTAFRRLGLEPKVVGEIPGELNKKKTQRLG